jgi:hypothetical protein
LVFSKIIMVEQSAGVFKPLLVSIYFN